MTERRRWRTIAARRTAGMPASGSHRAAGMTLIELMIATTVLAIGLPAIMLLLLVGLQTDSRSRTDTTATILDQEVIEKFATLKNYPKPTMVNIYDCNLAGSSANLHQASLGSGPPPSGNGAALLTSSGAGTGDVDWTQTTPALATSTTLGYAMLYRVCSGEIYEVRWNIMDLSTNSNNRMSLLTVSARPRSAVVTDLAGLGTNRAILYARPTTLKTIIENN